MLLLLCGYRDAADEVQPGWCRNGLKRRKEHPYERKEAEQEPTSDEAWAGATVLRDSEGQVLTQLKLQCLCSHNAS